MDLKSWKSQIETDDFSQVLKTLYGKKVEENRARYRDLLSFYKDTFGETGDITLFSAPGRTEIGGNHTDHQHGRVLAASVDMDMIAAAAPIEEPVIRVLSRGYRMYEIPLDDLSAREEEKNTSRALLRGVAAGFAERGCSLGGFQAVMTSAVLRGSGISSSAAYEVLMGNIMNTFFFGGRADPVTIAAIGQFAENVYFGKPSGMLDQTASSVGNILTIDFEDTASPLVKKLDVDFEKTGLALCIVSSGADHSNLTDEYAAIPAELKKICTHFGKEVLREVPKEDFISEIPILRKEAGDRAVLRAMHFYSDNDRVPRQVAALESGDLDTFLELVTESGLSSWTCLQNIVPCGAKEHQEMAVTLALCEEFLEGRGAYRVHGGGFAGTVQAFVPVDMLETFRSRIDAALGQDSCHVLSIRPVGGTAIRF